jgi:predicted RNA-binding Zn-ribbon protein involved in translation (DUF1610 family)
MSLTIVSRRINLEKVKASLNTPCTQCGHEITPAEIERVASDQLRCPKCGCTFTPEKLGKKD